jgi:membrane-associated phospholipid phosphatase
VVLLLVGLNGVITDAAKTIAASPRPDAVDVRVQPIGRELLSSLRQRSHLSLPARVTPPAGRSDSAIDAEGRNGFPSGHVSGTTVFFLTAALLIRRRWLWGAAAIWIPLMALSRMYLGRHFLGDVVGGLAVGAATVFVGLVLFGLRQFAAVEARAAATRSVQIMAGCALVVAVVALVAGVPDGGDAGRFLGLALGAAWLAGTSQLSEISTWRTAARRVATAACGFCVTWLAAWFVLRSADSLSLDSARLVAIALPSAIMLVLPGVVEKGQRGKVRGQR